MLAANTSTSVPFLDLSHVHRPIAEGVRADLDDLIETGAFTNGPSVQAFEAAFAEFCASDHCIGVASGLDALRFALIGLELEPGAEVLVPAMTFIATFEAVTQAGGIPVPVDASLDDYGMDADAARSAIGPATAALMPVHLYGRLADMTALEPLARAHDLPIVEDACQAHGASRDGYRAGSAGHAGAFSFYPGKNLGAFGDAGALVTNDSVLAGRVRSLREHGQRKKYDHGEVGWTSRLDSFQACVLLRKLEFLADTNEQRRKVADLYADGLAGVGDLVLPDQSDRGQVWHLYVVRTGDPAGLAEHLKERQIGTGRHYPEPPHLSGAYASLGYKAGAFPVAEQIAREALSLPMYPGMEESQVATVVAAVQSWFAGA